MWTAFIPAIIAFCGVLVGAAITTGANYLLAVRKERAEETKERRARAHQFKAAARLVLTEFMHGSVATKRLIKEKRWATAPFMFPLDAWQEHRDLLAHELPLSDWTPIEYAAGMVEVIRNLHNVPRPEGDAPEGLAEIIEPFSKAIDKGVTALYPYTADEIELILSRERER